jgi:hypothetical protein
VKEKDLSLSSLHRFAPYFHRTYVQCHVSGRRAFKSNMLIGAYYAQYLTGTPFADDWAECAVDAVLRGLTAE